MSNATSRTDTVAGADRRGSRLRDPRPIGVAVLLIVFVAIAPLVPVPGPEQIRDWAQQAGPWFPFVFFIRTHPIRTLSPGERQGIG